MADESMWIEKAQSCEAKLATMKQAYEPALERIKEFKANFGIKERSNGELVIDYEKFIDRLGLTGALELRQIIDEKYNLSGKPGEKPHISIRAAK